MLLKRIYDEDLAHASYLIGCQATGTAVVVDPRRDIGVYLDTAAQHDLRITDVTETHIHADYLSGARELAAATGATLRLSDEGGPDWLYRFEHEGLRDGDEFKVGNITLRALHTPGHTPEHLSFLVTDRAHTDQPGFLLTGDFMFVGDLGRPDLLDEAAGAHDTRFGMARQLYGSLQKVLAELPAFIQVLPGHGAGSACGKSLGAVDSTTLGYEKATAWWAPFLQIADEQGFVDALLSGQPDAPLYFGRMKRWNRQGAEVTGDLPAPKKLAGTRLEEALQNGAILLDTRPTEAYSGGHVPGALHVPSGASFVSWAAWVLDPERSDHEIILLADTAAEAAELRQQLQRIGIDRVSSYASSLDGLATIPADSIIPARLDELADPYILDVRGAAEFAEGHLPDAHNIHSGRLLWQLDELPRDRPLVIHCQTGARSPVVASALRQAGFSNVLELEGSYDGWKAWRQSLVGA